jgi:hypothetical protein
VAHTTQVSFPFFTDVPDKDDWVPVLNASLVQGCGESEERDQASAVVADAGTAETIAFAAHIQRRACRENRIHVRGDRKKLRFRIGARTNAKNVAKFVPVYLDQAYLFEAVAHPTAALLFAKGWPGNCGNRELPLGYPMLVPPEP